MPTSRPPADHNVPTFSIVVPMYNVAAYLEQCLDSILRQSFGNIEVIVVDDASTDASPEIARQHADRDPRIRLITLPANTGLGMARNTGVEQARGRYLLFVDSDDTLPAGALQAVADRIEQTGGPDVVMFAYAWSFPDGRVVPDPKAAMLTPLNTSLTVAQRIQLLKILPAAWNKAYRREYIALHRFRFPNGVYEDVPWTYPVLMSADTLVTTDRVCYHYRQRVGTSLLASGGPAHFGLISQYDRVFDYLDAHPAYEPWRRPLLDRMAWHVPTVLETSTRIPRQSRRAYFEDMSTAIRRHRPAGYRPAGRLGLKVLLIERAGFRVFRTAQLINQLRRRLDSLHRSGRTG